MTSEPTDAVAAAPTAGPAIELTTLTDGGQRASEVGRKLAGFLGAAEQSLDLAVYDVRFETDAGGVVLASLLAAVQRGVAVRLLYNVAHPGPIPVPPPPETAPEAIESLPVPTRGVAGIPDLMHHKYVDPGRERGLDGLDELDGRLVDAPGERDRHRPLARDRVRVRARVRRSSGRAAASRTREPIPARRASNGARVRAWFCPEHGEALSHRVAKHIGNAKERVRIASPGAHLRPDPRRRWSRS